MKTSKANSELSAHTCITLLIRVSDLKKCMPLPYGPMSYAYGPAPIHVPYEDQQKGKKHTSSHMCMDLCHTRMDQAHTCTIRGPAEGKKKHAYAYTHM